MYMVAWLALQLATILKFQTRCFRKNYSHVREGGESRVWTWIESRVAYQVPYGCPRAQTPGTRNPDNSSTPASILCRKIKSHSETTDQVVVCTSFDKKGDINTRFADSNVKGARQSGKTTNMISIQEALIDQNASCWECSSCRSLILTGRIDTFLHLRPFCRIFTSTFMRNAHFFWHVTISASSGFPTVKASFRNSCQHTTQEVSIQESFSQPTSGTKEWVCPLLASTIKNWLVTFSRTPSIPEHIQFCRGKFSWVKRYSAFQRKIWSRIGWN